MEDKLQQQIEDYLEGQLSESEKSAFEVQMQQDKTLAAEVQLFQEMNELLGEADVLDFSATLDAVMQEEKKDTQQPEAIIKSMPTRKMGMRRWLSIAAGFALMATIGALIYTNLSTVSPDTLYANHIEFPTTLGGGGILRSADAVDTESIQQQINNSWQAANEAYGQNEFNTALQAMAKIETLDPRFEWISRPDFYFKKGLVQLKANQLEAAIASFDEVISGDYVANAQWKRALALLKVDVAKAKIGLQEIANSKHPERLQAAEILEAL